MSVCLAVLCENKFTSVYMCGCLEFLYTDFYVIFSYILVSVDSDTRSAVVCYLKGVQPEGS